MSFLKIIKVSLLLCEEIYKVGCYDETKGSNISTYFINNLNDYFMTKTLKESLSVLKFKEAWLLSIFYCLTFGGFVTFSVYLPALLVDLYNMTAIDAGIKTAGFVLFATFLHPVGGYLSDRFGAKRLLTFVFSGALAGGLFIAFSLEYLNLFSIGCLAIAVWFGIGNGAVFKLVPEVSSENIGAVTGIVGAAGGIGGFIPPIIIGLTKDITGTYFLSFALLSMHALICIILIIRVRNRKHVNISAKSA